MSSGESNITLVRNKSRPTSTHTTLNRCSTMSTMHSLIWQAPRCDDKWLHGDVTAHCGATLRHRSPAWRHSLLTRWASEQRLSRPTVHTFWPIQWRNRYCKRHAWRLAWLLWVGFYLGTWTIMSPFYLWLI